ncbi:MAG TPA: Na+/H+ antiporter NhaC family protein [bacterium]
MTTFLPFLRVALFVLACLVTNSHGALKAQERAAEAEEVAHLKLQIPGIVLSDIPFDISVEAQASDSGLARAFAGKATLTGVEMKTSSGKIESVQSVEFQAGRAKLSAAVIRNVGKQSIIVNVNGIRAEAKTRVIPGVLSLLPPLFAIALAFVARQVLLSLFCGIWLGCIFVFDYDPLVAFIRTIDTYFVKAIVDSSHASILIFSMTLGGMVGVISKAGGTQGIVQKLSKYAKTQRGGQLATWAMGILIFFDDYANTLIVGNTMRPFTDRLRVSREKLSYIVDSTSAPVASIALVSTWIGFQIGLIDQAFDILKIEHNAYSIFLQSIPFSTYSILAVLFVLLIALAQRDFGPMYTAEIRALTEGKVLRDGAQPLTDSAALDMIADERTPLRWYNALIPILTVILVTIVGLYVSGKVALGEGAAAAKIGDIFGAANSFSVLLWASFTGLLAAMILTLSQKILTLNQTLTAVVNGYKSMLLAAMILVLAWAIGDICKDLHTADYVIEFSKGILSPHIIPFVTFTIAAFISFSTGTSWATMAILTPIVIPIAYQLPVASGLNSTLSHEILIGTVGAVLSGSVMGDHCSPISDTTILSSMSSAADHVDHVRTQIPYALLVGLVSCLSGYLPNGWGFNTYLSLLAGLIVLAAIVFIFGKPSDRLVESSAAKNQRG